MPKRRLIVRGLASKRSPISSGVHPTLASCSTLAASICLRGRAMEVQKVARRFLGLGSPFTPSTSSGRYTLSLTRHFDMASDSMTHGTEWQRKFLEGDRKCFTWNVGTEYEK